MVCGLARSRGLNSRQFSRNESRLIITGFFLSILSAIAHAQTPVVLKGSGVVEGRVTCNDGGFPARKAKVHLYSLAALGIEKSSAKAPAAKTRVNLETGTDFDGYYHLASVPPGDYIVAGRLTGYSAEFEFLQQALSRFPSDKQKELLVSRVVNSFTKASNGIEDLVC